jgi:hypothetical protein
MKKGSSTAVEAVEVDTPDVSDVIAEVVESEAPTEKMVMCLCMVTEKAHIGNTEYDLVAERKIQLPYTAANILQNCHYVVKV